MFTYVKRKPKTGHHTPRSWLCLLALPLLLSACNLIAEPHAETTRPTPDEPDEHEHPAVIERQRITVSSPPPRTPPRDYRIGPDDELLISVFDSPELGTPPRNLEANMGSRVDGQGKLQLPLLDELPAAGMTVAELRQRLQQAYGRVLAEPSVTVEIVRHRSQPVYLVGQFHEPGVIYMDRPTNVLQALARGGGLNQHANLRAAHIQRDDRVLPVDLYRLFREGDLAQNIWLQPDDAIYIPDDADQRVFVFGSVQEPGPVPMVHGQLTLSQALNGVGGPLRHGTDASQVRIIRSHSPTRGELLVIDQQRAFEGRAMDFPLQAGDIVYVPRSGVGTWNDAIQEILPSLQVVGAALQPFVQIEVLRD